MCGIIGYLDKRGGADRPVGRPLLAMLEPLARRGPDSVGVALFGPRQPFWIAQVKLPDHVDPDTGADTVLHALLGTVAVIQHRTSGAYLRLEVMNPVGLEEKLMAQVPGAEIVSLGHQLEIVKQVGSPAELEKTYAIRERRGSHGIGHARLSTESRVDLSHSQPFWVHGVPDLATVHHGHITNYHKLRRRFEQRGYRFFTENDSEVIGAYLRDRMAAGLSLADALRASLDEFDGSYSYLAASSDGLAYVRDRFGFKPLIVADTDDFVAIATEETALRRALGTNFTVREPAPGTLAFWPAPA